MRFGFLGLSLAGIAAAVPSEQPGLKIIVRETSPASVVETTEYVQSDRIRVESRWTIERSQPGGEPLGDDFQDYRTATIRRCDLNKIILLNYDDATYVTRPLRIYPSRAQRLLAFLAPGKPTKQKSPNLLIETTTVPTGERKMAFEHSARRVITTRRHVPLDEAAGAASETETDGWYIDLESQPSCERLEGVGVRAVLLVGKASSDAGWLPEFPTVAFKDIGAPEHGYPVELKTRSRSTNTSSDGTLTAHTHVTHKVVRQLSREPLDPALFETPAGFRAAEGRLAAFAAQLSRGGQTVRRLLAALFQ